MIRGLVVGALVVLACAGCAKNIPAPDIQIDAGEAQLARGKYLATTMGCIVCHSRRDWSKLGGPLVEGSDFGGSDDIGVLEKFPAGWHFGAPNLTPHHLRDWSDGELVRAIVLGQDRERHGLFPIMPYFVWRDSVPLEDVVDVVAYLRTLPALDHDSPKRELPIPGFVFDSFPEPRVLPQKAPRPGEPGFPAYVVARSACIDCHTDADDRGNYVKPKFSGGREFAIPAPGKGFVHSSNLTPDPETGLGRWTKEMFIARFKSATLEAARAQAVGDDGTNTVMPWWAYASLSDEDLGGIWDSLHALPPVKNAVRKFTPTSLHR